MQQPSPSPDVIVQPAQPAQPAQAAEPAQPTQPAQAAPPPAAQPGVRVIVQLPNGPLEGLATTPEELEGLYERQRMVRQQIDRANSQRSQLVNQLANVERQGLPEARVGIQQRLDLLDARILQLDRDLMATDRVIDGTSPKVLSEAAARRPPDRGPQVDEDEAVASAFGAFGFGIVLTLVISRLRRRFARRRAAKLGITTHTGAQADDPRIDRLNAAVDAIAEEVERIGEGQRFVTQLLATRTAESPLRVGEAERR